MGAAASWSSILGLAVGAGINLYAAVLVTGLAIRHGWLTNLPAEMAVLANPVVLIAAGVMYAAEFVADKVPFFTPIWDGIHTFIRPAGAALLAMGVAADMDPTARALAMLAAGTVALGAHSSKMGLRLMAHATPEPATHSTISVLEDFGVVALLGLAFAYPWAALVVIGVILVCIALFVPFLVRVARFLVAGLWGRVASWLSEERPERVPAWTGQGSGAVRAWARHVPGAPRLAQGWLDGASGKFVFRRWGVRRELPVGRLEPGVEWGFVYNVAHTADGASFYLTKDWCPCLRGEAGQAMAG
jgi:hypothetical protein